MKLLLALAALLNLMASCAPGVEPLVVPTSLPPTYLNAANDTLSIGDTAWRQLFLDAQLRELVGDALVANADVNVAVQRVAAAQAALGQTTALQRPNIAGSASLTYTRVAGKQPLDVTSTETITPTLLGATATSFDVDLFGTLRYATAAQRARVLASDAARQAVLTVIVNGVASAYFLLQELHRERDITNLAIANRHDNLHIVALQVAGGTATLQTQRQAETALYTATAQLPDIERQIGEQEDLIAKLLGRYPASIPRGLPLERQLADVALPAAGLPGQLLLRRPDIRSAELTLESDNLQVASARAAIFPQLTLGGSSAGVGATILNGVAYGPQGLLTLVPALSQTIADGGFKRSTVNVDRAQREADLYVYLQTIQAAMQGVTDGLTDYARYRDEVREQTRLTGSLREYARLADLRYRGGVGSYLDVLDSESRLFSAELALAQLQLQQRLAEINVYTAVGGGWQDAPAAASAPAEPLVPAARR
ncbi:MAG: efflux transporter outer membrane subunit [Candidatus Velthaea sp.]|jgi:multidrug efflux system outer membrane protein